MYVWVGVGVRSVHAFSDFYSTMNARFTKRLLTLVLALAA